MMKGLNLVAKCTFTTKPEWKLASAWAGIQTFPQTFNVFRSLKMNVVKLSGSFLRHGRVQSSPLSAEKIHSKQHSAGGK